jgi:hypothetical protein
VVSNTIADEILAEWPSSLLIKLTEIEKV